MQKHKDFLLAFILFTSAFWQERRDDILDHIKENCGTVPFTVRSLGAFVGLELPDDVAMVVKFRWQDDEPRLRSHM